MISFDLRCGADHVTEIWFRSSADFERQQQRRLIACPTCGDTAMAKAAMAPNIAAKGNRARTGAGEPAAAPAPPSVAATPVPAMAAAMPELPAALRRAMIAVATAQAAALPQSRWVGDAFAVEARAAHAAADDQAAPAPIHGRATPDEVTALAEDGIAVMPLLVPFIPPEARN